MDQQLELEAKRKEVREEILALKEQTPLTRILNFFGRGFKNNIFMFWLSNIIWLHLILFGPWVIIGLIFKENVKTVIFSKPIIIALEFGILGFVTSHLVIQYILDNIANRIIEKINNSDDLSKFLLWFRKSFSVRNVLVFVLPFCVVWASVAVVSFSIASHEFVGFGLALTITLGWLLGALVCYVPYWVTLLASNLKNYQYDLNAFSPADSEIIHAISDMLTKCIYILAIYFAIATLVASSNLVEQQLKVLFALPFFLTIWMAITIQFIVTRSTLGKIANGAKWKTLNKLQTKINSIEATGDLSDKETSERLLRLVNIHERVVASKTNTFDLKSLSTFVSQLMLPLLGLLLGNLDKVIALLR